MPVIRAGVCAARTMVWPPVPQPMSAILEAAERLSTKSRACTVTAGLPGPWRSSAEKYAQMRETSNSWMEAGGSLMVCAGTGGGRGWSTTTVCDRAARTG